MSVDPAAESVSEGLSRRHLLIGATLASIAALGVDWSNPSRSGAATTWGFPLARYVTPSDGFGPRSSSFHEGIDYPDASGPPIYSIADGIVNNVANHSAYGLFVEIEHDNGWSSFYAHLRAQSVTRGQRISRGTQIGLMGNTGASTGTHLHLEMRTRPGGSRFDPAPYVNRDSPLPRQNPAPTPPVAPDPPSPAGTSTIMAGQQLVGGQYLVSADGRYRLSFQTDGNLVVYAPGNRALFSSDTWGNPGTVFKMQADGNAVIYATDGRPIWNTGTWGNPGARLTIQNDGNAVLYRAANTAAWYTGWDRTGLRAGDELLPGQRIASPHGRYHVTLQHDGNIVVYESQTGRPLFFTGSYGAKLLRMQVDGNLVSYYGNGAAGWNSNTWREGNSRVVIQDDGNLVIYRADGSPSWYSGYDVGQRATSPTSGTYLARPRA